MLSTSWGAGDVNESEERATTSPVPTQALPSRGYTHGIKQRRGVCAMGLEPNPANANRLEAVAEANVKAG